MNLASITRLLVLAAIWGSSFLFMRISVPVLGPFLLIELRVGLAAVFLTILAKFLREQMNFVAHWRHFVILSLFNSALPFLLFAYAAQTLSASLLSVLNATAPIWGALVGSIWTRTMMNARTLFGLALGVVGVSILVGFDVSAVGPEATLGIAAALFASLCYGIASNYTKFSSSAKHVTPFANAQGGMVAAALMIMPCMVIVTPPVAVSMEVAVAVLALGVVCSGMAYLLYFRLIDDLGATSALTVTFLIPVFGVAWGAIFLGETVVWQTILGGVLVISGTALVTGYSFSSLRMPK